MRCSWQRSSLIEMKTAAHSSCLGHAQLECFRLPKPTDGLSIAANYHPLALVWWKDESKYDLMVNKIIIIGSESQKK